MTFPEQPSTSPDESSGIQMHRITPSENDSVIATVSGSGTSSRSTESYVQNGIIQDPSRFLSSRWLLGSTERGLLTRDAAARGMLEATSQESLNRESSPRGRCYPPTYPLPISYSDGFLSHMNRSPQTLNPQGASMRSPGEGRRFLDAPAPSPGIYYSPTPVRTDLGLVSRDIYLPASRGVSGRGNGRETPAVYMSNMAKRRMEIRRDSGVQTPSPFRRDI